MNTLTRWNPFGVTKGWDPFAEIREMQHEMDRLFDRLGKDVAESRSFRDWAPSIESYRKGDSLIVRCELPGVDPKDVDVTVDESSHILQIKGERKAEKETKEEEYIHREMVYGTFTRSFALPEGVKTDQVKAKFTHGVLAISIPVAEAAKAKKIEIETPKIIEGEKAEGKDVKKAA